MTDPKVLQLSERVSATIDIDGRFSFLFRMPTAVVWNRLEGRPRSQDLARPLRAEVRDPAWMLARQMQFGEFEGGDSGTPIQAKVVTAASPLRQIRLGGSAAPQPYDPNIPVEFLVEQQPVEPDFLMGVHIGRRWLRQLSGKVGAGDPILDSFREQYPVTSPAAGDHDLESLKINSNPGERALRKALANKSLDGAAVLRAIRRAGPGERPSKVFADDGVAINGLDNVVDGLAADLLAWFDGLFGDARSNSWIPGRLEYEFSMSTTEADGSESRLVADQFPGGHLDWYSFDRIANQAGGGGVPPPAMDPPKSFVPTPVTFFGAPAVRWWEFEDSRVGFGLSTAAKTDLAKILLAEFGLVFSNDWFILPYRAETGSLLDVKGIVVTDNFGFNTLVEPVAKRHRELGFTGHWSMWTLARRDQPGQVDARLFLAPTLEPSLESKPVDEVLLLRDEMANLVWGVETVIPGERGGGRDARLAAKQLSKAVQDAFAAGPDNAEELSDVLARYQLMGSVPENWIPFVAVKLSKQPVATSLLQGAMPRDPVVEPALDADGKPVLQNNVVLPRGTILARDPVNNPNLIHDDEQELETHLRRRHETARKLSQMALIASQGSFLQRRPSVDRRESISESVESSADSTALSVQPRAGGGISSTPMHVRRISCKSFTSFQII